MKILLIRHGQTDWNVIGKVQGESDIPLNQTGIEQAQEAKSIIDSLEFDLVISSPKIRAFHTAEIVCKDKCSEILKDHRIRERSFGDYEGQFYREDPIYLSRAWSLDKETQLESAESYHDFYDRVKDFLEEIYEEHNNKTVLLVAHGGVSIAMNHYFYGVPESGNLRDYLLDNCAVAEFNYPRSV